MWFRLEALARTRMQTIARAGHCEMSRFNCREKFIDEASEHTVSLPMRLMIAVLRSANTARTDAATAALELAPVPAGDGDFWRICCRCPPSG